MVPIRRRSLHSHLILHGTRHDPRHRLPLLRARASKIRTLDDLGVHGFLLCDNLPMVLLGLLPRFLIQWDEWVHWGFEALWTDEYAWRTESGKSVDTGVAVFVLSDVLCNDWCNRDGCYC